MSGHTHNHRFPFGELFKQLRSAARQEISPEEQKKALQQAAQLALQVEFTTIPVYLTGMYSIKDTKSDAYQALRAVAMEEMFHVNQAANLVVALGKLPRFAGKAAPQYPCYLPHANTATTPFLSLVPASQSAFSDLYAAIETPAAPHAPAQLDQYDTIAQLYDAFRHAIEQYPGNPFDPSAAEGRQRTDIYLGKFGGDVRQVACKDSALHAIHEIVSQGEGRVPVREPLVPVQPYGTYNHYGMRTDGTYGPILGTPYELSHFSRFTRVATSSAAFPDTYPIFANPQPEDYAGDNISKAAQLLSSMFNGVYSQMLLGFEKSFMKGHDDLYFSVVLGLMHRVLPQLALTMANTALFANGDASTGPCAAPLWKWVEYGSCDRIDSDADDLSLLLAEGAFPKAVLPMLGQALGAWKEISQGMA